MSSSNPRQGLFWSSMTSGEIWLLRHAYTPSLLHPDELFQVTGAVPGRARRALPSLESNPVTLNVCWPPTHQPLQSPVNIPLLPSALPSATRASALPLAWKPCPRPPAQGPSSSSSGLFPCHSSLRPEEHTLWGSFLLFLPHPLWVPAGRNGPSNTQGSPSQTPRPLPRNVGFGGRQGEVLSATIHQVAVTEDPWAEAACFCVGWGLVGLEPGGCGGQSFE